MSVSRIYRLLRLITMLQSGQSFSVDELAEELQVSRRTVFRDMNMLEMAHVPYYFDREKGTYRVNQHFFLAPLNLTLSEALSLLVSTRRTQNSPLRPLASCSQRAAMKLESVLPAPVREYLGQVLEQVDMRPAATARHEGLEGLFDDLLAAVGEKRVCRIVYISFHDKKQLTLTVHPLRMVFVGRAWYLRAWSVSHQEVRTFKLGRIKTLAVLSVKFEPADSAVADQDFGSAWSMIPEGRLYDVHLRFSAQVGGNVAEVNWHSSQQVSWNSDGSVDFKARVDGLGEISWWILGYGDQVQVLCPQALADRVSATASRVVAKYQPQEA